MNKTKPIIIAVLILLILGGAYAYMKLKSPQENSQKTATQQTAQKSPGSKVEEFTGSLADILKMGSAVKCTGSYSDDNGTTNITVYASGNKSYSEMTVNNNDQGTFMMHGIFDGDWMYSWGDYGMATKMKVSDIQDLSQNGSANVPTQEDYQGNQAEGPQAFEENYDYSCTPWVVDNSKFTPPSDVEFTDMSQMMKDLNNAMDSGDTEQMKQMIDQFAQ